MVIDSRPDDRERKKKDSNWLQKVTPNSTYSVLKSEESITPHNLEDKQKHPNNTEIVPIIGELDAIPYSDTPPIRIRLSTPKTLRKSMARILRMAARGEIDMDRARSLAYLAQTLGVCFKLESDLSIERELKILRHEIHDLENRGLI